MSEVAAIILAAGSGDRFGSDKMMEKINRKKYPWEIVHEKLSPLTDNIIVVGKDIPGGLTRRDSVIAGLRKINGIADRVIIAEGARFLVSTEQFDKVLSAGGDAVTFGSPAVNTHYSLHLNEPIPRINAIDVHTPQAFSVPFLIALLTARSHVWEYDEWSLACNLHRDRCNFIEGDYRTAMKLTYRRDLAVMEALYALAGE